MIRASAYLLIVLMFLFLLGCDGAAGPDGDDAPFVDRTAPQLELVQPQSNAVIIDEILILEAALLETRNIEGGDLDYVQFYVNGSSVIDGDTARVYEAPYLYVWDMDLANTSYGPVAVSASATDTLGNTRFTSTRIVTRFELAGVDTLTDRHHPGTMDDVLIPDLIFEGDDTVRVTQLAVRFDPYGACVVNKIRLFPVERFSVSPVETPNYWVGLATSPDGTAPGETLDSMYIELNEFELDRWHEVDLSSQLSESVRTFGNGESFFVTIRPDVAEPDSMDIGLRIGSVLEADTSAFEIGEHAYWYERPPEGIGWTPVVTRHLQGFIHHPFVDAIIEYLPEGEN